MVETRPELVVETGTYRGGSAFFLASICDLLGAGEVVSIDIEPVRDDYPAHPRITYLGGRSSTDPDVVADVRARAEGKRTLVILDSDHSQAHVEAELAEYAPLVPVGCYVIVEDSNIGQIRKDLLPGPLEAIEAFLARTDEFEIDREAREVPDHVEPERLSAPGALGAGDPCAARSFDDAPTTRTGPPTSPEHETGGGSLGDASTGELDARLREDVVRDAADSPARARARPTRPTSTRSIGRPSGTESPMYAARSTVELKNSVRKSACRSRAEPQLVSDVELRHARVVREPLVDPGALEAAREDAVLGRLDQALPREGGHGCEDGGDGRRERHPGNASAAAGASPRAARGRRARGRGGRRPARGPASSASIRTHSAPGTVSMPASFASWRKGRTSGEHQRRDGSERGSRASGRGRPEASQTTSPMSHSGRR